MPKKIFCKKKKEGKNVHIEIFPGVKNVPESLQGSKLPSWTVDSLSEYSKLREMVDHGDGQSKGGNNPTLAHGGNTTSGNPRS